MGFTGRVRFILEEMNSTLTYGGTSDTEKRQIRRMGNKDKQIFHGSLPVPVYTTTLTRNAALMAQLIKHERKFLTRNGM